MSIGVVPCYRKECAADAGYKIRLMCGEVREVCFDHLHDFILERGSVATLDSHLAGYARWRAEVNLPPMEPHEMQALVQIARQQSGYEFSRWEY